MLDDDDSEPPTSPSGLTAVVNGQKVTLYWTAATDNIAVTGYRLYCSTSAGFTASDTNRVAFDGAGTESSLSNEVSGNVTLDGAGVYLYPPDLGWSIGGTKTDTVPGGQTLGTLFSIT